MTTKIISKNMLKKNKKFLTSIFLLMLAVNLISLFFILTPLSNVSAVTFTPQVEIGDFKKGTAYTVGDDTSMIGAYIKSIYEYAVGIVGIIAAVVLMFGGILYLTAGGSADKISNAKSWIGASLTGLVLVLASYLLLSLINPDLVNFKIRTISDVGDKTASDTTLGCCWFNYSSTSKFCLEATKTNCNITKNDPTNASSDIQFETGTCNYSTCTN